MTKHEALKTYFGHSDFREGQEKVVDSLLGGRDVMCVMPTGAGKSVCYEIPALLLPGITLVISPLISLMKDQVSALREMGVGAAFLNSSLTFPQYLEALRRAKRGMYKIIYVAPERLSTEAFADFAADADISLVAVDEAHCVSQWGQDFRPSYAKIVDFVDSLEKRPVVGAFTATATAVVGEDIKRLLGLKNPFSITTGFDRKNLFFEVRRNVDKNGELLDFLKNSRDGSGIVYCSTRKNVEEVCELLCSRGFAATRYHAGLDAEERKQNQEDFVYDRSRVMVATNAFGMGIDKSNVSFVIHYNMPKNLEGYYQEAGRAGRDGEPAQCVLFYSGADVRMNEFLLSKSEPDPELDEATRQKIRERDRERLRQMTFYCTTGDCLRGFILNYFGERPAEYCANCSNCLSNFETVDIAPAAREIVACIASLERSYGVKMISDILRGNQNERVVGLRLDESPTFGALKDLDEKRLRAVINHLVMRRCLDVTDSDYPTLTLTEKTEAFLAENECLEIRLPKEAEPRAARKSGKKAVFAEGEDAELFAYLKKLRALIAKKRSVPAYVVFSDATLHDMCRKKPTDEEEFLEVAGVGEAKLRQYGAAFIKLIYDYNNQDN